MTFPAITNRGEFFSNHYLDTILSKDLNDLRSQWDGTEGRDEPTARTRLRGLGRRYFPARADAAEAIPSRWDTPMTALNDLVLTALGFTPLKREPIPMLRASVDKLEVTPAAQVHDATGLILVALDGGLAADVDDLFDVATDHAPGQLLWPLWRAGDKKQVRAVADAVGDLFACEDPPRYVLVCAGRIVLLAERARWAEGRFLAVDLDAALERNDTSKGGELETIAALFSADVLVPSEGPSVLDTLTERSHKHAVGVSKELRHGIRQSIEILANEVIAQRLASNQAVYAGPNRVDPKDLTRQCLRWLYRVLVLLYAESRPELGVLPANDEVYTGGYSLDRLRELLLVDLDTDQARNGSHLHQSLQVLFDLANEGNHPEHAQLALRMDQPEQGEEIYEEYLHFPGLEAGLFGPQATPLLDRVTLRNEAVQHVLQLLMLSPESRGRRRHEQRGFISYAQLGINQLGAVYEGLMSYTGFFAEQDLFEVAKDGDPDGGTWVVPVAGADRLPDNVYVTEEDPLTGRRERVRHERGSFVFRLSGRDRQRSASYYTPEVLTRSTVHHALAELLGLDKYAPEGGSAGITQATDLLELTICEPALGSGAFLNEAINQLSAEYLKRRQAEVGESLDPERYRAELAKVKTHFAIHQSYGVDLNATAVELAEVSVWLNCMHPGLKAPWFMFQLRRGNSLVGARRATLPAKALRERDWAERIPDDRPLNTGPIGPSEVHHFLLPAHSWFAVADAREAKELRPEQCSGLRDGRRAMLARLSPEEVDRAERLAQRTEELWAAATQRLRNLRRGLRRPIDLYGARQPAPPVPWTPTDAMRVVTDPDSPLGRLRAAMDAWVGLWFWPVREDVAPPSRSQWFALLEQLVGAERSGPAGQLDLFDTVDELQQAEQAQFDFGAQPTVQELRERNAWFDQALALAQQEAAWHWELEFAPVFADRGGFDLQVGNPPWVRPRWEDDVILAEIDPWFGVTELKAEAPQVLTRKVAALADDSGQADYLVEVGRASGLVASLGSAPLHPALRGVQTNLYQLFMELVWRNGQSAGSSGLIHPEGHFSDPAGAAFRTATFERLRRHWQFRNELQFFEIHNAKEYGVSIYGNRHSCRFIQLGQLLDPATADLSLEHDGSGALPGVQYPAGGWDLRPHVARVVTVDESVLGRWAQLFDEPGTPALEARLLRPVTTADLRALDVLSSQSARLADHGYSWTRGHEEDRAKRDGTIRWETAQPTSWDEVILQGPHFTVGTPFAKQPREHCRNNKDYEDWGLEQLPEFSIPRTNYQRDCDRDTYVARLDHWNGRPFTDQWRVAWRRMVDSGTERSLQAALIPPGPAHVHTVHSLACETNEHTVRLLGLWTTLPMDYLVKVSGKADVQDELAKRFPFPYSSPFYLPLVLRTLRLNCLTVDYGLIWEELFHGAWRRERWAAAEVQRSADWRVGPRWSTATPLLPEQDRRLALVELDALAALIFGLSAEQLCAMYRTQFAVLRKYEHQMVFDAEGRKLCAFHQSAGYRQGQLQDEAKAGKLPKEWQNLWKLYLKHEADPGSVDWLGYYTPPFTRADREAEMTHAYNEFAARAAAGEYDD